MMTDIDVHVKWDIEPQEMYEATDYNIWEENQIQMDIDMEREYNEYTT